VELKLKYQEEHTFYQRAQSMLNDELSGQFNPRSRHQR
jgi:hypothetical protein